MSLLSDLLARIKHPEPRKDVPPGLRNIVSSLKKKESSKKLVIIITGFVAVAFGSGILTVYFVDMFMKGGSRKATVVSRQEPQTRTQNAEPKSAAGGPGPEPVQPVQPMHSVQKGVPLESAKTETINTTNAVPQKETAMPPAPPVPEEKRAVSRKAAKKPAFPAKDSKARHIAGTIEKGGAEPAKSPEVPAEAKHAEDVKPQPPKADVPDSDKPRAEVEDKDPYLYLAQTYELKHDYPNALLNYKKVLGIEPRNYRAMNNIASILLQLGALEEAKVYLQMALGIRNDYVPGIINMGIVLARLEKAEEAESFLLRALTLDAENRQAILNLAILYEKQGKYARARDYYQKLQQLGDAQGGLGLERIKAK